MRFGSSFLNRGHLSTLLPQNAMAVHSIFQRIDPRWLTSDTISSPLLFYKLYLIQHFFFLSFRNFLIRKMRPERLHNRSIDLVMAISFLERCIEHCSLTSNYYKFWKYLTHTSLEISWHLNQRLLITS
jgi:hypothetical protein